MGTVTQYLQPEEAAFPASAFPQFKITPGTSFPVSGLAYDAAATETAFWKFTPASYGSGDLTVEIIWYADTSTTSGHTVRWDVAVAAITPNTDTQDVETKAFDTSTTVDDAHLGTTGQRLHQATAILADVDNMAAGDEAWLKVSRIGGNAADTLTGDAILTSVRLYYSDT